MHKNKSWKIIDISSPENLDNLHSKNIKIRYYCKKCHKEVVIQFRRELIDRQRRMLCKRCGIINTSNIIYDCDFPNQNNKIKLKIKNTLESEFGKGITNVMQVLKYKNNFVNTICSKTEKQKQEINLKKSLAWQKKSEEEISDIVDKRRYTCRQNLGVDYPMQSKEIISLQKLTKQKKYGNPNFNNLEKRKLTKIERYNDPYYSNREKANNTIATRYGGHLTGFKYNYHGIPFSSTEELAVWIYCIDHSIPILREPVFFKYIREDGSIHLYYPDFYIFGIGLVEIKGELFWNNDKLINPYNLQDINPELKHRCGLQNGVKFWKEKNCQFAIDYVNEYYGINYLPNFKNINAYNLSYEYPSGFLNISRPYLMIPVYYTPLSANNQVTIIDNPGIDKKYIMSKTSKGITPYDLGYSVTHKQR